MKKTKKPNQNEKKPLLKGTLNVDALNQINTNIKKLSPHPKKVKIIAVTKKFSFSAIQQAKKYNIFNIGENKIQEFEKKKEGQTIPLKMKTHFIGRLQRNKIKKAIKLFNIIQSVDSLKTAKKINEEAKKIEKIQEIYLQINISEDPNKQGFKEKEIYRVSREIKKMKNLKTRGTMTIIGADQKKEENKKNFKKLKEITQKIKLKVLPTCIEISMGMSQDYKEALEEGATNIRIGTKLYG